MSSSQSAGGDDPGFARQADARRNGAFADSETSHRPTPFGDLEPFAVLTAQGIAARLGVDPRSVRRANARGELPASRTCGIRVLACDAAAWWQAMTVTVPALPSRAPAVTAVQSPAADIATPVGRLTALGDSFT